MAKTAQVNNLFQLFHNFTDNAPLIILYSTLNRSVFVIFVSEPTPTVTTTPTPTTPGQLTLPSVLKRVTFVGGSLNDV